MNLVNRWFDWLGVPRHINDREWHEKDQSSELAEFMEAKGCLSRWSESSDVVFTNLRSRWDGVELDFPLSRWRFVTGFVYGICKFTLRSFFYRHLGNIFGKDIRAIRNPHRARKLRILAEQYAIDPDALEAEAKRLLRFWPLLP